MKAWNQPTRPPGNSLGLLVLDTSFLKNNFENLGVGEHFDREYEFFALETFFHIFSFI